MRRSVELCIGASEPYPPDMEEKMRALTQLISESETQTLAEIKNVSSIQVKKFISLKL